MAVDTEKFEALYEYQKQQFDEQRLRFDRLESKSTRYLGSITIAVSAYVLLVRGVMEQLLPPSGLLGWLVVVSIVVTFVSLASAWSMIFRSMKLQKLVKMDSSSATTEYFKRNKKESVYLGLAEKYSQATGMLSQEYEIKLEYVRKGYNEICFTGWCFFISTILIFAQVWAKA